MRFGACEAPFLPLRPHFACDVDARHAMRDVTYSARATGLREQR
jgi:hypothetical protein